MIEPPNSVREAAERFQASMDQVRLASQAIERALRDLEVYAREQAGEYRSSTDGRTAYDDMANRIKALLG